MITAQAGDFVWGGDGAALPDLAEVAVARLDARLLIDRALSVFAEPAPDRPGSVPCPEAHRPGTAQP